MIPLCRFISHSWYLFSQCVQSVVWFPVWLVSSFHWWHSDPPVPLSGGTDWFNVWYASRYLEYGLHGTQSLCASGIVFPSVLRHYRLGDRKLRNGIQLLKILLSVVCPEFLFHNRWRRRVSGATHLEMAVILEVASVLKLSVFTLHVLMQLQKLSLHIAYLLCYF